MPGDPTVSVVIPTHDRRALLPTILAPLLAETEAHEVIVVVDGSTDGSADLLRTMAAADSRVVPIAIENRGEAAARQAGVERATGEIVLLLDDDVEAGAGLVAGHAHHHDGRRDLVVVGYMPPVLEGLTRATRFTVDLYAEAYENRCRDNVRHPQDILRFLWAGNVSLRREDCLRVGLVNPRFAERYHPDREFGLRCLEAGLRGSFDRSLRARHHYRRTLDEFVREAYAQGAGGTLVHLLHPVGAGALSRERFSRGLPAAAVALVELTRRPRAARVIVPALTLAVRACGRVGLFKTQALLARLLRRVERQRGAIDLHRRRRATPTSAPIQATASTHADP